MRITRGDSEGYRFGPRIDANGQPILTKAEAVYFTVKKNFKTKEALIQKTIDDMIFDQFGVYHFTLDPADTEELPYGVYTYDIEVSDDGGNYKKTITKGKLIIDNENTWKDNEA